MSDAGHALDHPDAAGYALGALDRVDLTLFEDHLATCERCQAQVAEFTLVVESLALAAPAAEPPGDLEFKVLAAVQAAAAESAATETGPARVLVPAAAPGQAERGSGVAVRARRWRQFHWASPLYAAVAAAAVTAAVFIGSTLIHSSPAVAATVSLSARPGYAGSGTAIARAAQGGFEISLTVKDLPASGPGQFYECWYAGPGNRPGHPELITAGTFTVTSGGSHTFSMWSAANPASFKVMQITLEQPGDAGQHGKVILSGTART
jgi:hypothetical protein